MAILYVGIDLAKNVFAVHGVNNAGKAELVRPSVPRARLHGLPPRWRRAPLAWKRAPARTKHDGAALDDNRHNQGGLPGSPNPPPREHQR